MRERMAKLKVGDALARAPTSPRGEQAQLEQDLAYLEIGRSKVPRWRSAANCWPGHSAATTCPPALFAESRPEMRINRERSSARGQRHPGARLRGSTGGGQRDAVRPLGGIATTSLKHATHFKRHAQAGMVMVNLPTAGVDYHVPFGGRKGSSYGAREQGGMRRSSTRR